MASVVSLALHLTRMGSIECNITLARDVPDVPHLSPDRDTVSPGTEHTLHPRGSRSVLRPAIRLHRLRAHAPGPFPHSKARQSRCTKRCDRLARATWVHDRGHGKGTAREHCIASGRDRACRTHIRQRPQRGKAAENEKNGRGDRCDAEIVRCGCVEFVLGRACSVELCQSRKDLVKSRLR